MVYQNVTTKAQEVKLSLNSLMDYLDKAAQYTYNFDGAPEYVTYRMRYFNRIIRDLQRQARALRTKVPMKFRNEV